jgi:hypothetical protein
MKKTILLSMIVLANCNADKTHSNESAGDSVITNVISPGTASVQPDTTSQGNDCIFNDDYKGLTTDALKKLQKDNFIWSDKHEQAAIPQGQDTIIFSEGGCYAYSTVLAIILNNDSHDLADSTFWIQKALELAHEFGMNDYEEIINNGKLRIGSRDEGHIWFEVEDIHDDDNTIYNGIEVTSNGSKKRLEISQYMD